MKIKRTIGYVLLSLIWATNIYTFCSMGFPYAIYGILIVLGMTALAVLIIWLFKPEEL